MMTLSSADSKDLTKIFEDLSKVLRNPSNLTSILGDQFSADLGDVRKDVLGFLG